MLSPSQRQSSIVDRSAWLGAQPDISESRDWHWSPSEHCLSFEEKMRRKWGSTTGETLFKKSNWSMPKQCCDFTEWWAALVHFTFVWLKKHCKTKTCFRKSCVTATIGLLALLESDDEDELHSKWTLLLRSNYTKISVTLVIVLWPDT